MKLKCDEALSNVAFSFNLRRYTKVVDMKKLRAERGMRDNSKMLLEVKNMSKLHHGHYIVRPSHMGYSTQCKRARSGSCLLTVLSGDVE